jgi:hypothetical protein
MADTTHGLFLAPGELLMSVTGLTKALRPGPIAITQGVLAQANPVALDKTIKRRLLRFMKGQPPKDEPPEFDYDEICDLLPEMQSEARNVENLAGFQTQFLAEKFAEQLGAAVGYVQKEIPDKIATFARKYRVLDMPLLVLDEMCRGWLVDEQVDALVAVYPAIYDAIRRTILETVVATSLGRKSWRLPYEKDLQLGILLREPRIDGLVHQAILQRWEEKRDEESKGQGSVKPPSGTQRRGVGDPSTQQERLEAK